MKIKEIVYKPKFLWRIGLLAVLLGISGIGMFIYLVLTKWTNSLWNWVAIFLLIVFLFLMGLFFYLLVDYIKNKRRR